MLLYLHRRSQTKSEHCISFPFFILAVRKTINFTSYNIIWPTTGSINVRKETRNGRGDRGQSVYGARPPLGFYFVTISFLVIPEI